MSPTTKTMLEKHARHAIDEYNQGKRLAQPLWADGILRLIEEHTGMENTLQLVKDLVDATSALEIGKPQA